MNVRVSIGIVVVLALIAGAAYFFFFHTTNSSTFSCAMTSPQPTIVAFGDSLVAGYGAPTGSDFVTDLSMLLDVPITNLGHSGDTTAEGLARIQSVLDAKPDIVIVLLGGNDALQQVPVAQTKANLSKIIETLQAQNIRVVLIGVLGGFPSDPFASMFQSLANQYKVVYVSNILSGLIANSQYMSDEVHPNAVGYAKIAARLYPVLTNVCEAYSKEK